MLNNPLNIVSASHTFCKLQIWERSQEPPECITETSDWGVIEHPPGHTHHHHKGTVIFLEQYPWEINTSNIPEQNTRRSRLTRTCYKDEPKRKPKGERETEWYQQAEGGVGGFVVTGTFWLLKAGTLQKPARSVTPYPDVLGIHVKPVEAGIFLTFKVKRQLYINLNTTVSSNQSTYRLLR